MNDFAYRGGRLFAEGVPLDRIAREVGTPTYVYGTEALIRQYRAFTQPFQGMPYLLCYSVKASSNLSLLKLFARLGAGFDIVSEGELRRVLRASGDARKVVFSGVGKTEAEMAYALRQRILLFNVESAEELDALDRVARRLKTRAPFAIRVNPDVDPKTHRYIATGLKSSKFGVPFAQARLLYEKSRRMRGVLPYGLDCHIGSQLTDAEPVREALQKVAVLYRQLTRGGFPLEYLDVGGGLGIAYSDERPPSPRKYAEVIREAVRDTGATIILEPGRLLVGNGGILLTRVLYRKKASVKTFVVVDAGMNDLIRPALYDAYHEILPLQRRRGQPQRVDLVGPVCESSDVLARGRSMVLPRAGDVWAIMSAGAYGMTMASNYNSRLRPAEVLVDGSQYRIIRHRDRFSDLVLREVSG
jgi:diaminopimelate decarboxylase